MNEARHKRLPIVLLLLCDISQTGRTVERKQIGGHLGLGVGDRVACKEAQGLLERSQYSKTDGGKFTQW